MKKMILPALIPALFFFACRKPQEVPEPVSANLTTEIINETASNVFKSTYSDLQLKAAQLHANTQALSSVTNETNLTACKQSWRDCRAAWEQSEAFLFGPVSSENIDPRIDTWPVNFNDLDSILAGNAVFTAGYVDSLDDALKGFHPVEYLLFGLNGNKTASAFTPRELEYLNALAFNLEVLTTELADYWNSAAQGNYFTSFTTAGNGSTVYSTERAVYEEMVNAMIGICEEVAAGKMGEPFIAQDPSLEESPFAFNSITDFTNNIRGVRNVYLGMYSADGKGIEDLVRAHNLSLDGEVKQKIDAALATLGTITVPFGQAITQQPVQVQNSINAIEDLKHTLENDLLPFVQLQTN